MKSLAAHSIQATILEHGKELAGSLTGVGSTDEIGSHICTAWQSARSSRDTQQQHGQLTRHERRQLAIRRVARGGFLCRRSGRFFRFELPTGPESFL